MTDISVWTPKLKTAVASNTVIVQEIFDVTTDGQRLFDLETFTYSLHVGALQIFKNGVLLKQGTTEDWVEATESSFILSASAAAASGDTITALGFTEIGNVFAISEQLQDYVMSAVASALGAAPLNDGQWASGVTFTNHKQFMVYNNVAYGLDYNVTAPYTTQGDDPTAEPDASYVTAFDNYVEYTTLVEEQGFGPGNVIYPRKPWEYLSISSTLPATYDSLAITHIRISHSVTGKVETVKLSSAISGTVTAIDDNSITAGTGTAVLQYPHRAFNTIAEIKLYGVGGSDGDTVEYAYYETLFTSKSRTTLFRDTTEDDVTYASTDWNDNGLINDKLICFGPNGEAWVINSVNLALSQLGAVDGAALGSMPANAVAYLYSLGVKTSLDIDIVGCTSDTAIPVLNSSYLWSVRLYSTRTTGTQRHIDFTAGEIPLKYYGGSGGDIGESMTGVKFGTTDAYPVLELKGICGAIHTNCTFASPEGTRPIVFTNDIGTGTFTEYNVFQNCIFIGSGVANFIRGSGNDSFRGNSFVGGIAALEADTTMIFEIGDSTASETGNILWYEGELSLSFSSSSSNEIALFQNTGGYTSNGHIISLGGQMKGEMQNYWHGSIGKTLADGRVPVYLAQSPIDLLDSFSFYNTVICGKMGWTTAGAPVLHEAWSKRYIVKEAGTINSFYLNTPTGIFPSEMIIRFVANNYVYGYTLLIRNNNNSGNTYSIANWQADNTAGYGAVTFTYDATEGDFYVTPTASWAAVEVEVQILYKINASQARWSAYAETAVEYTS